MARRKTLPESVRTKQTLAERLASLRAELFGDRGGPELARRLGLPIRTWYNYEAGVTVPAEVILKIIELTAVEPMWLLHGRGPKYRRPIHEPRFDPSSGQAPSVESLLRTALEMLERGEGSSRSSRSGESLGDDRGRSIDGQSNNHGGKHDSRYLPTRSEWQDAQRDSRCIQVSGDAMSPIIANEAHVAFAKSEESLAELDGKIVVAWVDDEKPIVRWFHHHGRFALLRAENQTTEPNEVLLDLEDSSQKRQFRRVLWINTPH